MLQSSSQQRRGKTHCAGARNQSTSHVKSWKMSDKPPWPLTLPPNGKQRAQRSYRATMDFALNVRHFLNGDLIYPSLFIILADLVDRDVLGIFPPCAAPQAYIGARGTLLVCHSSKGTRPESLRLASADLPFGLSGLDRASGAKMRLPTKKLQTAVEQWRWRPRFAILLHTTAITPLSNSNDPVKSLENQLYQDWTWVEESDFKTSLCRANGDYLVPLCIGDMLSNALFHRFAETLHSEPAAAILYGDQDELDSYGRRLRPGSSRLGTKSCSLAQDYVSAASAIEIGLVRKSRCVRV